MKKLTKIIATIAFTLSATFAHAVQTDDEFCADFANAAASIMTGRQNGLPMGDYLKILDKDSVFRIIVIEAYELPRMSYEPNQQRMIEDFRNKQELFCIKAVQSKPKATKKKPSKGT